MRDFLPSFFRRGIAAVIFIIPFVAYPAYSTLKERGIAVTYLDAGQADAAVVEMPDKKVLVIDTGRSGREVAAYLKYKGIKDIDALILSHQHPDHAGGLDYLMKNFRLQEVWDNGRLIYPGHYLDNVIHRGLERGDITGGRGYEITVLHPYREFYTLGDDEYSGGNNSSLVVKITGEKSFLFAGDVEEEAEEDMAHLCSWIKSDVIKLPHHGSRTSASADFLGCVQPEMAVISVGADNKFGHPHDEMVEMLKGKRIFRTDMHGAVKIEETMSGLRAGTYEDFRLKKAHGLSEEINNIKRLFEVW